ncbi:CD48 antigen isoform X2 [Oryzias melastigma]|uniref:CD48 antigen isoform X2 n=1 Tax=Oryzias melastigma TaxID=30732 RepID=UPI00168D3DCB|nr:CD48 antigen isoform X2 [Oryzias melastigma]
MALMPSLVLFFLTLFAADVHSVKVLDVLKGSTVVLTPDDVETSIISVTWKHGEDLAAEWFGGSPTFYHSFNDRCSLNTETGELTINDVRLEHSGVYTPEINNRILTDIRLQVLSPVPKPSIISNCNSEQTRCILTCVFDRTDDLGDVQVFWILDDSSVKEGRKLSITKETTERTFICRLNNPVSSESSTELINPLLPNKPLIVSLAVLIPCILIFLGVLVYLYIKKRRLQRSK